MIRSMTGYSGGRADAGPFSVTVSIKSLNHRYLDLQMRLPPALEFFESHARRLLKERAVRGHFEVTMSLERHGPAQLKLDRPLLEAYLRACQGLRAEFGLRSEPDLVALLRIPGVVNGEDVISEPPEQPSLQKTLEVVFIESVDRLNEMREREGEALARDSVSRLERLVSLGATVKKLSGQIAPAFRQRLERRIRELVQGDAIDPYRIAQEVTLACLRSDIAEEVTRFESHVTQARCLLAEGHETGKKLDFLLQEMNREANTILAKTTDLPGVGAEIGSSAIEMKVEIEKLREQAQNIE
jgi:uncharacterized protein (TIGR00255 family)